MYVCKCVYQIVVFVSVMRVPSNSVGTRMPDCYENIENMINCRIIYKKTQNIDYGYIVYKKKLMIIKILKDRY